MLRPISEQLARIESLVKGPHYRNAQDSDSYYSILARMDSIYRALEPSVHGGYPGKVLTRRTAERPEKLETKRFRTEVQKLVETDPFTGDTTREEEILRVCRDNHAKVYTAKYGPKFMADIGEYAGVEAFAQAFQPQDTYQANQKEILCAILGAMGYADVPFKLAAFGSGLITVDLRNQVLGKDVEFNQDNTAVKVFLHGASAEFKPLQNYYPLHPNLQYLLIYDSAKDAVTLQDIEGFHRENLVVAQTDRDVTFTKRPRFFCMPMHFKRGAFFVPTQNVTKDGWVLENRNAWVFDEDTPNHEKRGFILVNWKA